MGGGGGGGGGGRVRCPAKEGKNVSLNDTDISRITICSVI